MNMRNEFSRTELLLGADAMKRLAESRVAVFGLGGVGGYTVEALARSGVGALDIVDSDRLDETNINRQILATHDTMGRFKTEVAAERIASINPDCKVRTYNVFYLPNSDYFDFSQFDYIVDAVDTVAAKLALVQNAKACGVPIVSAMGAGNKLDPTAFEVADIFKTSVCPLAKVMRRELRKLGVDSLKVVYSKEEPVKCGDAPTSDEGREPRDGEGAGIKAVRRSVPASVAFVPSVAGLIVASVVVKDLIGYNL